MSYLVLVLIILVLVILRRYFFNAPRSPVQRTMIGKNVIVTGSSAGIGKETARDLLKSGATVIFACRDERKTKAVISEFSLDYQQRCFFIKIDLACIASIFKFVEQFREQFNTLDILINNAGLITTSFQLTEDKIENTIQANVIGHIVLTNLLLESFNRSEARIINLSSEAHKFSSYTLESIQALQNNLDFNEVSYSSTVETMRVYGNSKLGNIYYTNYLAELSQTKFNWIKAVSVHPGAVNSEFTRYFEGILPYYVEKVLLCILMPIYWYVSKDSEMGAQTTLYLCYENFDLVENGGYYLDCHKAKTTDLAQNKDAQNEYLKYCWMLIDKVIKDKYVLNRY